MSTTVVIEDSKKCPKCGALLDYDEVDIGVGVQRGNYRCEFCGWSERDMLDEIMKGFPY